MFHPSTYDVNPCLIWIGPHQMRAKGQIRCCNILQCAICASYLPTNQLLLHPGPDPDPHYLKNHPPRHFPTEGKSTLRAAQSTTKWPKDPQSCCCNAVLFSPKILFCFQLKVFNLTLSNAISWSFSKMFLLSRRIFATSWWLLRKRDLSEPDRWVEWQGHGYYILGRASRQRHMFQEY